MTDFIQTPLKIGNKELKHRIIMAPLTRGRATADTLAPNELHVEYYSQRATEGGLIISEATLATPWSISNRHITGIFNEQQALEWKKVVDAVHAKGALFSQQCWEQGIVCHSSYTEHPLAKAAGVVNTCHSASATLLESAEVDYTTGERIPYTPAHALTIDEIHTIQEQYIQSVSNALTIAGADFVELHWAHGYLFDQFFQTGRNKRTDEYGGSIENRLRFAKEVLDRVITQFPGRIAVRISPHQNYNGFFGASDENPTETYTAVVKMLRQYDLAYMLMTEPVVNLYDAGDIKQEVQGALVNTGYLNTFREVNKDTPVFAGGGFTPKRIYDYYTTNADTKEEDNHVKYDGIAVGRFFISNPDLVFRLVNKLPLNLYDRGTFYPFPVTQVTDTYKAYNFDDFFIGYTNYPTFIQVCEKHGFSQEDVMADEKKMEELIKATQNDTYPLVTVEALGNYRNSAERDAAKKAKQEKA